MSALDDLAPDQRAVLQLVLQRGRSYDEIAQLLSIDRAAVRQRALDAFDGLTPATVVPGPEQALVTDYLLGQLPDKVAEQVYSFLEASGSDRAWAQAIVAVIGPLVSHSLPEIPVGAPLGADETPQAPDPAPVARSSTPPPVTPEPSREPDRGDGSEETREPRPSSRRGGAILLSVVAVMIAAAIIIAVANSGSGGGKHHSATTGTSTGSQVGTTSTTGTAGTTSTSGTTGTTTTQILAQLNLHSPTGASGTVGIVDVARVKGVLGMVIYAQGVPPNSAHNAYAVWLYNSPTSHEFVGFVPNLVGKNGKLVTEGQLPPDALAYHNLLVTLETQRKPTAPGEVVLKGPFREHP